MRPHREAGAADLHERERRDALRIARVQHAIVDAHIRIDRAHRQVAVGMADDAVMRGDAGIAEDDVAIVTAADHQQAALLQFAFGACVQAAEHAQRPQVGAGSVLRRSGGFRGIGAFCVVPRHASANSSGRCGSRWFRRRRRRRRRRRSDRGRRRRWRRYGCRPDGTRWSGLDTLACLFLIRGPRQLGVIARLLLHADLVDVDARRARHVWLVIRFAASRRGVIRNSRSIRSRFFCARLNRLPSSGMSPSTGILSVLLVSESEIRPPSSRLWPSSISACVLTALRVTSGILTFCPFDALCWTTTLPSSICTIMRMRRRTVLVDHVRRHLQDGAGHHVEQVDVVGAGDRHVDRLAVFDDPPRCRSA